jgi:hypothetical protein
LAGGADGDRIRDRLDLVSHSILYKAVEKSNIISDESGERIENHLAYITFIRLDKGWLFSFAINSL